MSKKSRKRNKKILAALALAGGAAMLAKGRGKGAVTGVVNPNEATRVAADVATDVATPDSGGSYKFEAFPNPGTRLNRRVINPHEETAAAGAAYRPRRIPPGSMRRFKGGGIAKRGTGVALKSGGRVKSMGIAKRGGGAAKK